MRRTLAIGLAGALALAPAWARADPPPDPKPDPTPADIDRAREIFENGEALFAEGSYDGAIAAFRRAFQLSGEPNCLFNIALSYDRLDDFDGAIEYLQYYRAYAPRDEHDAIADRIAGLQARKLRADEDAAERAEAERDAPPPTPAAPSDARPPGRVFGPGAIAATAIAVAGFGVGAGLGIASLRRKDEAASLCGLDADGDRFCPASAESALRVHRRFALGADIALAIGAAGAVTAIVLVAVAAGKRKRAAATAWSLGGLVVRF